MDNISQNDPTYLDLLHVLVPPPESGAQFRTLASDAKMAALVLLAPGDGLSNAHRRMAEAHPFVECSVRGDPDGGAPAPFPEQFHKSTLRWMIERADKIAIWAAPYPQRADDVREWWNIRVHFGTLIETNEDRAPEWQAFINRWKPKNCSVEMFSSHVAGGIQ
jgi:hypothetical protein